MTITADTPPARPGPGRLLREVLTGAAVGGAVAAFVVGCVLERASLVVLGPLLGAAYGLLLLATRPRRRREAAVAPRTALARIEALEAAGGEATDMPTRFELSVVPDGAPAFRVEIRQEVHVAELADLRAGGAVVVTYPPDRPERIRIVRRPTPEWEERAAGASLDPAPGPLLGGEAAGYREEGYLVLLGLLLGVAAVLLPLRAELFGLAGTAPARPGPAATASGGGSTTTVTSGMGTVVLGPGRSMLDPGELRAAVESLTERPEGRRALTLVVRERLLTVVLAPSGGTRTGGFDPRSLPYDRLPALVEEAGAGEWQVTADALAGPLVLRIVVTGDGGARTLEADGRGRVLRRTGD
ncbi:hypothetical protein ACIQRS_29780 [Streptomyces termitum]|uniref:DUF3592 domain-containing protein n=1 Tax=Streptomyces termitum TaxID=67368 RepID=A0A918WCU4_9ACTN|nr:hypothetical protein [Streptomyces termitum]GHB08075.1 hypothetical protein GCM10010305_58890 [Streptomyces termitum]